MFVFSENLMYFVFLKHPCTYYNSLILITDFFQQWIFFLSFNESRDSRISERTMSLTISPSCSSKSSYHWSDCVKEFTPLVEIRTSMPWKLRPTLSLCGNIFFNKTFGEISEKIQKIVKFNSIFSNSQKQFHNFIQIVLKIVAKFSNIKQI